MRVISCITTEHNLWLVLLAAFVCISGGWITLNLLRRSETTLGLQRGGWLFLTSVAAGSSVWCTHFIAMLAYETEAAITFGPILTMVSLLVAVTGCAFGFTTASLRGFRLAPEAGGLVVGLAISAMHYTGMMAYHVDGIIEWNVDYVASSIMLSMVIAAFAFSQAIRRPWRHSPLLALALFVLAVVTLHFTAMAAVSLTPLATGAAGTDPHVLQAMAIAVAGVGLLIVGTGVASYMIDEHATQESIQKLQHMALNDLLTGLPNRGSFADHLNQEMEQAERENAKLVVIGIDLDRFKEINDLRGHKAGDQALKAIGRRLARLVKDGEFVARVGGDEFAAVKRFNGQNELLDFVARLEKTMFEPIRIDDFETVTGASIGVAVYPDDGRDQERLVSNADLAMYRAKADVGRAVCFYESRMDEAARERHTLAQDLRRAVELDQLELHYQVQTSVRTGEVCGYEVLARWNHPERGKVPPAEFIPIAEESGTILAIGEWVLRTACKQAASWDKRYKIAVNLSPVQFAHADLARLVHEILLETGLSPSRLELEITESTIIADKTRTLHVLRQIKALGVTIAIDDFGTGYSSLDTLRSFPFDKIKLDRSFMSEVEGSIQAKAIVRAVLTLGRSLEIPVLAEGVETNHQLEILKVEGCDEAQGFFLGRPKPVGQIFLSEETIDAEFPASFSGRIPPVRIRRRSIA
ncbi:EAL domain-containing protein [Agrobacterium rhizogenes]|uniref:putative bifunctional diguanylate cyclase/phosphodiesterase n=1 Tax=Rhizobium rhizogenes TaxID=359 RepID=UPI001571B6F0|nr:EAL domain-containing protein [Rhizobium rhizogenes]NTH79739.1 EAL domain-containing protein [Rhizobium rhizogenes]NTH85716.1 EAL domain-containing protein [Rhizobium rhizogenes]NTI76544.1 EAL domain-containing protein [Rhizobium rhizogenes]